MLDQTQHTAGLFAFNARSKQFRIDVARNDTLKRESISLLEQSLIRGECERGDIPHHGLPERSARGVPSDVIETSRFPVDGPGILVPRLFPQA